LDVNTNAVERRGRRYFGQASAEGSECALSRPRPLLLQPAPPDNRHMVEVDPEPFEAMVDEGSMGNPSS
jgi:hypothetical protein